MDTNGFHQRHLESPGVCILNSIAHYGLYSASFCLQDSSPTGLGRRTELSLAVNTTMLCRARYPYSVDHSVVRNDGVVQIGENVNQSSVDDRPAMHSTVLRRVQGTYPRFCFYL